VAPINAMALLPKPGCGGGTDPIPRNRDRFVSVVEETPTRSGTRRATIERSA